SGIARGGGTNDDAPITLQRKAETIFSAAQSDVPELSTTGHEQHVAAEARRMYAEFTSTASYIDTLRTEQTRELRASQARLDQLVERSQLYALTADELDECATLRSALEAAEAAARAAHNRRLVEHYGHPDAAIAVE